MIKLPEKKFRVYSENPHVVAVEEDLWYVNTPSEESRLRKNKILLSLDESKLKNSLGKSSKNKPGYSDKEMVNFLILLGSNTAGLKSTHVETLLRLKKEFETSNFIG